MRHGGVESHVKVLDHLCSEAKTKNIAMTLSVRFMANNSIMEYTYSRTKNGLRARTTGSEWLK
jgi:hypothetical protein